MTLTIDKNNDKISNTKLVWDDEKMVYKLSFDYTFACDSGLTVHHEMTIHDVSLWHNPTDGHSFLIWNDISVFEFDDDETIFEEELDDSKRDMLFDEKSDVYYAQSYDDYADDMMKDFLENGIPDDEFDEIIFNIVDFYGYDPNHKVSFFKKMLAKMGWTFRETDMVQTVVTNEEQSRQDWLLVTKEHGNSLKYSFRLKGMDSDNQTAYARGLMIHGSKYLYGHCWMRYIPLHRVSCQGCVTVSSKGMDYLWDLVNNEKKPLLLWSYNG